ncbi:MAG: T9SS type A sorting domain-containing protein [Bacteroidia bacterium]|nr:T9SS type A sorting domain-containing protein [Bacteroidia bacterium]
MKIFVFIIFGVFASALQSQVVPDSLTADWPSTGFPGEIPQIGRVFSITDFNSGENVTEDWDKIFLRALESLEGRMGVIWFPPGEYKFHSTLVLPDSCILRGAGADSTHLIFDLGGAAGDGIFIGNRNQPDFDSIPSLCKKGTPEIAGIFLPQYLPGTYIEIRQKNGSWDTKPAAWAQNCTGQFARIAGVNDSALILDQVLRTDFLPELYPQIRPINPRHFVGIECLSITRNDTPEVAPLYNIHFNYANRCWVRGVESRRSIGSHIMVDASAEIEITGSYFHESVAYDGSGTHGYGITLIQHASQVLVEDNIFRHLRHAMMVKQGANGNVFAYNYSTDPYRTEFPNDLTGDISVHGHFPYSNLFEGNIVANIITDHYWGAAGPGNMFFRNRAELYGISLINLDGSNIITNEQILVGNETTNFGPFMGNFLVGRSGHFLSGNHIKGLIQPTGTEELNDTSYYRWDLSGTDPLIGLPNALGQGTNAAARRFQEGKNLTVCAENNPNPATALDPKLYEDFFLENVFPNPFSSILTLEIRVEKTSQLRIRLTTVSGKLIKEKILMTTPGKHQIRVETDPGLPGGIYVLEVVFGEQRFVRKLVNHL